ncbi:lipopolysaccharide biosynthesis protein [Enterococcus faecium]|uniref:lipopolysaccharide biosynthesis protein n=1 Tax=Enterococcus faecium TaxID=1352 RepID=UPI0037A8D94D
MNLKSNQFLRNISYALSANLVVLFISVILNLFVPKYVGVQQYSMWQLYLFYSSYTGFFPLGWIDGISLKYAGEEYDDIKKTSLGAQYWILFLTEFVSVIILLICTNIFVNSGIYRSVYIYSILSIIILVSRGFILIILQSANRIREYAALSRNDRFIYIFLLVISFFFNAKSFHILIGLDLLSKFIILLWGMYIIRDLLFKNIHLNNKIFGEIFENIRVGSSLMFSNIASMLISGIPRWFVERKWDVETFGKLSLTLNISNLFMVFMNAIGIVLFPILRRANQNKLSQIYRNIRSVFVPFTYCLLIFFFPIKFILEIWLPEYSESMSYMGILFPMIVYEGRVSLLINTFLKTIRKEKSILYINLLTLVVSVTASILSINVVGNLSLSVFCIMFTIFFRGFFLELLLFRELDISMNKIILIETLLTFIFVLCNSLLSEGASLLCYVVFLLMYLFYSRKNIWLGIQGIKYMLSK